MTLIYQETGVGSLARCVREEIVIAANKDQRILFHKKLGCSRDKKIEFPLVNIQSFAKQLHILCIRFLGNFYG